MRTGTTDSPELCPTGVQGLDEVLAGGLPANRLYLVQGDPGAGKTTLALQFLLEGLRRGEPAFYITLSETRAELEVVARSHGWTLDGIPLLELSAIEPLLRPEEQTTVFHPSELELDRVTRLLLDETARLRPARVVFDSLSELRLLAETPLRHRWQLLRLKQEFARIPSTVLMLDDKVDSAVIGSDPHVLSLAHGVVEMEQLVPEYGRSRRRLRVLKLRGVGFREGYHDYLIERGGLRVFPRLMARQNADGFRPEPVGSGLAELDALLGGGLDRGTTTLVMGPSGTGKSTLALHYAAQMAARGERAALFAFDEVREIALSRAAALGVGLASHVERGLITLRQMSPAELSPGEFAALVMGAVEAGSGLVVIDTLNGYLNAMPGDRHLLMQMHELSLLLNQRGVVTILILAEHGMLAAAEPPVDLTYLADTVVTLRFFEAAGAIRQAAAVVKKRSGAHERTIREFTLEPGRGIRVGRPLRDFRGVLTGVPEFVGRADQMMDRTDAGE